MGSLESFFSPLSTFMISIHLLVIFLSLVLLHPGLFCFLPLNDDQASIHVLT